MKDDFVFCFFNSFTIWTWIFSVKGVAEKELKRWNNEYYFP